MRKLGFRFWVSSFKRFEIKVVVDVSYMPQVGLTLGYLNLFYDWDWKE